jgi:hypothetical protein
MRTPGDDQAVTAAPLNASRPPKVLNVVKSRAVPATSMPLWPLPADTLPSGMTPPTCTAAEFPSTRMPSRRLATRALLLAPEPKKSPRTTVLTELVMRRPFPPFLLTTL